MLFLILIYLAFVSLGLPDSILGTSWPLMRVDLNVPVDYAGFISFTVAGGTIISSLLSHRLIKRFGTGTIVVTSVFMTASALLGFALSRHFIFLVFLAVPLGLGADNYKVYINLRNGAVSGLNLGGTVILSLEEATKNNLPAWSVLVTKV